MLEKLLFKSQQDHIRFISVAREHAPRRLLHLEEKFCQTQTPALDLVNDIFGETLAINSRP